MVARDKKKKAAAELKSQQKIYKLLTLKVRRDSGIWEALEKCGIPAATYAQSALREKLICDGFLQEIQGE